MVYILLPSKKAVPPMRELSIRNSTGKKRFADVNSVIESRLRILAPHIMSQPVEFSVSGYLKTFMIVGSVANTFSKKVIIRAVRGSLVRRHRIRETTAMTRQKISNRVYRLNPYPFKPRRVMRKQLIVTAIRMTADHDHPDCT